MPLLELLNAVPLAGLMAVVALGWSLGRVALGGVSLGPAGATLFLALGLGHLGLAAGGDPGAGAALGTLGFALFIYSVGFDAAPHVAASFRDRRGVRFVAVAACVNALALAAALAAAAVFALDASSVAGLLAGALTSAPTYAAASEVAPDRGRLALAFALTFPFGLTAVVLLIQLAPRVLGEDLARDARSEEELAPARRRFADEARGAELTRAFTVRQAEVAGRPLRELALTRRTGCVISRVRAGEVLVIPDGDTVLELGDRLLARGRVDELRELEALIGPEAPAVGLERDDLLTRRIEVRSPGIVGRSLAELGIIGRFHCVVTGIERGTLEIEPDADAVLARDDVVEAVGRREDLRELARALGRFAAAMQETDIAVYAGGIALGALLGAIRIPVAGFEVGLGSAAALLLVGLVLGSRPRVGPLRTHVPREARQLVRDLGILLFVGEAGLRAGASVAENLRLAAWETVAAGAFVNAVAVVGAVWLARSVLALRPVDAWASVAGGLTSSSALHAVRRAADSPEAAIGFATAYAVGSLLATLAGPVVVLLLR